MTFAEIPDETLLRFVTMEIDSTVKVVLLTVCLSYQLGLALEVTLLKMMFVCLSMEMESLLDLKFVMTIIRIQETAVPQLVKENRDTTARALLQLVLHFVEIQSDIQQKNAMTAILSLMTDARIA